MNRISIAAIASGSTAAVVVAVVVAVTVTVPLSVTMDPYTGPQIPGDVASANNAFAVDFYKEVAAGDDGANIFFSSASMYTTFSILYEGARRDTAAQMQDVFGFEPNTTARHDAAKQYMSSLSRYDPHATLKLANSLWVADRFEPRGSYLDIARHTYHASMEKVDFLGGGVERINGWADERTYGKIKKVLTADDVDEFTAMAILNAAYFRGTLVTFPVEDTTRFKFWKDSTHGVDADFMKFSGSFDHARFNEGRVLRMPYTGDRLSMLVVLPYDRDGMGQLQERLSPELIEEWRQLMGEQAVAVSMPIFEMRTHYDLEPILQGLGMTDAFDSESADLLGVLGVQPEEYEGGNLYVSKAVHDVYMNVNEEGIDESAVATVATSTDAEPEYFTTDHPFMFIIQDDESGAILFMGRVSDPTA